MNCTQANGPDPVDLAITSPNTTTTSTTSTTTTTRTTTTTSPRTTTCRRSSSGRRRTSSCGTGNALALLWTLDYPANDIVGMVLLLLASLYYVYFWIMVNHLRKELSIPIPVSDENPIVFPKPTLVGPQPMIF